MFKISHFAFLENEKKIHLMLRGSNPSLTAVGAFSQRHPSGPDWRHAGELGHRRGLIFQIGVLKHPTRVVFDLKW